MDNSALFNNLQALEDASFPKACGQCGRRFENEKDYIQNTLPYQKSPGISESKDHKGRVFLKLIRKCHCGQPILDHFGDRRDNSEQGELRRKAFNKVVKTLVEKGLTAKDARKELINHMNNKKSDVLEKMGVFRR